MPVTGSGYLFWSVWRAQGTEECQVIWRLPGVTQGLTFRASGSVGWQGTEEPEGGDPVPLWERGTDRPLRPQARSVLRAGLVNVLAMPLHRATYVKSQVQAFGPAFLKFHPLPET